jgi:hypothetical protein
MGERLAGALAGVVVGGALAVVATRYLGTRRYRYAGETGRPASRRSWIPVPVAPR